MSKVDNAPIADSIDDAVNAFVEDGAVDDDKAMAVLGGVAGSSLKDEIRDLVTGAPAMYSSIQAVSFDDRKKTLSALTNSVPVSENIGTVIDLAHIIVQTVTMVDRVSKVATPQPRVILIDAKGTAYHGISKGLFLAVRNIIGVLGEPSTWPAPQPIVVKRERASVGHFFTIEIAG